MQITKTSNVNFTASVHAVSLAKANGAISCPHAMKQVDNLMEMMEEVKQKSKKSISIVMVGKNVKEKALLALPKNASKKLKETVLKITEFLTAPYKACSGKCSKAGLTNGEVISNVFAIWDKKSNVNVGNPFIIKTTNETPLKPEEVIKRIKNSSDAYEEMRNILQIKKPSSIGEANRGIKEYLKELNIEPEDVNTKIARSARTLDD